MSDIDAVAVDSLKALDPEWPIREEKQTLPARIKPNLSNRLPAGLTGSSASRKTIRGYCLTQITRTTDGSTAVAPVAAVAGEI